MRALVTRLRTDGIREKTLVDDWPGAPAPAANQVKVRTLFTGVTNGTERNDLLRGNYANPDDRLPATWGYQNVGEVVETGASCSVLKVGDIVFSSSDHVEYATFAEDWLLVKLHAEVDRREAALFGMSSVAMRTCRHADLRMGDRVLVVGAGLIGQMAAQIANAMGARVSICDVDERRLVKARSIGAAEAVFSSTGDGWAANVPPATFDAVSDLAGVPGMEDRLIEAACMRGRVLFIAGRFRVEYTFNTGQGREITIKQNSHFDNSDLANLCRLAARGEVRIAPLLQDVVPVAEAREVYEVLRDTPNRLGGTVFVW
jgi:2-desacetyl-2-hydroxyethyl bacteriochlorophyllide A dehydrogenase